MGLAVVIYKTGMVHPGCSPSRSRGHGQASGRVAQTAYVTHQSGTSALPWACTYVVGDACH